MAESRPRAVGLVLSGGGTRLFAHIGFLWALDDAGLLAPGSPVGAVVGNSAGSLVGAMLALGYTPREMWQTAYWRAWGYTPPAEPRAWRADLRPRGLSVAVDLDFDGLARALSENLSYFKGVDTGLRFEALLRRVLERELADGQPNPDFGGSRPADDGLPLYLIGFNLTNRREVVLRFTAHIPGASPPELPQYPTPLGREPTYELVCDRDGAAPPKERFRPWEGVRVSTSLPLVFRPYYKARFWCIHWDAEGRPYRLAQGAYLSDGGSRDNYALGVAIKLAGCDAAMGCFLGDPSYPFQCVGQGTAIDVITRNIDGMMNAIFEADQDDAEILAHPVQTVVPTIESRPGVTFDVSHIGEVMEAGYIAAAYALRRLSPEYLADREFLAALVAGRVHLSWRQVFTADAWGPAAGREGPKWGGGPRPYVTIRPPAEFEAMARQFFAEQFPGVTAMAAAPPWQEEIARRNAELREVASEELFAPPFRDMPLASAQRSAVAWAKRVSWAATGGIVAGFASLLLALAALAAGALGVALEASELALAELGILATSVAIGRLGRDLAARCLWRRLQGLIRRQIGF